MSNQNLKNPTLSTIDENISHGINNGVLHLTATDSHSQGRVSIINDENIINFSSYSYLGLEHHPKLKQACIDAVTKYGTQFGYSRAFVSIDLYDQLENTLSSIFGGHVVVAPSTTLAHQAAMPVLFGDNDVILIDQHAHASMHFSVKNVRDRGIKVEIVRHNELERIEDRILALRAKYDKIWYVCDGVYSMYGDYAPMKDLERLMDYYPQFHVYVDDAHGMSWTGFNGKGYVLSQIDLHPQMILLTSLNKAYAGAGGAIVLPNSEWRRQIRTCGGTLIFSTPIQPPMLGVDVASAKLHLKSEFRQLQDELKQRIEFCRNKLVELDLPDISQNDSPIFYLPTGLPKVSYNVSKRMMSEGYHLAPTLFPAVSMKRAGLRYCMSAKNSEKDISNMLEALAFHYPKAVNEEDFSFDKIFQFFKIKSPVPKNLEHRIIPENSLRFEMYASISEVNAEEWDNLLGDNGSFDYNGLKMLERSFSNNPEKENNWSFYYFIVRDHTNKPIVATFFTRCWCKDDIFKAPEISEDMELIRQSDPYYLCTEALMMGSLITEGQHLYLDRETEDWERALLMLFDEVNKLQENIGVNAIYLRDFDVTETDLADIFISNGFVKVNLPDYTHELTHLNWDSTSEYLEGLKRKKRQQLRKDTLGYESKFRVEVKSNVSIEELRHFYDLYLNVKKTSYIINTFTLPFKAFEEMNRDENWEMIVLSLNPDEYLQKDEKLPVSVVFASKTRQNYIPLLVGLNYDYKFSHKIYKQTVYQVVKRANALGKSKVCFGITASTEKKRVGAEAIPKHVFVQMNDTFNMDVLGMASVREGSTTLV